MLAYLCFLLLPIVEIVNSHPALQQVHLQHGQRSKKRIASTQGPCEKTETLAVVGSTICKTQEDSSLLALALKMRASNQKSLTLPTANSSLASVAYFFESFKKMIRNNADVVYTLNATVGTNSHTRLIIDTGSSDIWVKDYTETSAAIVSHRIINVTYGQGTVKGELVRDRFCIGSLCNNQTFLSAFHDEGVGDDAFFDGLLGLAFPSISLTNGSYLQTLVKMDFSETPGFALRLAEEDKQSYIVFGEVSTLLEDAESKGFGMGYTVKNLHPSYWIVKATISSPVGLDGTSIKPTSIPCVVDSGTSLLSGPSSDIQSLYMQVVGYSNLVAGKCNGNYCLCDIEVNSFFLDFESSEGKTLRIEFTKEDLLKPYGINRQGQHVCVVAIAPSPVPIPMWILGQVFLRKAYVVHDVRNYQMTFFVHSGKEKKASAFKLDLSFIDLRMLAFCVLVATVCSVTHWLAYNAGRRTTRQDSYMRLGA